MGSEHYCLRWNNHQSNLLGVFSQLLESESLVDVTLACTEGPSIRAHKVVLSACSSYFQALFLDHPNRHPIVILKDVRFTELRTLVDFMYKGEVNVEYCQLSALLKTAESLKVKGLADMTNIDAAVSARDEHKPQEQQENQQQTSNDRAPSANNDTAGLIEKDTKKQLQRDRDARDRERNRERERENSKERECTHRRQRASSEQPPQPEITDCPAATSPARPSTPCSGPLALDRPRRDSEDAVSLEETKGSLSPLSAHSGPSDMCLANNAAAPTTALSTNLTQSRLPSPHSTEPLAGPSGMPPVQQVPLSLKKEVDWDRSTDERSTSGDLSTDYRLPPDPVSLALGLEATGWNALVERSSRDSSGSTSDMEIVSGGSGLLPGGFAVSLSSLARRCGLCLASFPSAWLLERHALLQHAGQPNDDKPFTCEQCGQRYRYRSAYVKHREQNHRARLPADKLFTCDVCGMQFRYLKSFKKHRLNHALERLQRIPESGQSVLSAAERSDQVSSTGEPSQVDVANSEAASPATEQDQAEKSTSEKEAGGESAKPCEDENPARPADEPDANEEERVVREPVLVETNLSLAARVHDVPDRRERRFACPFCGKCVRSKENLKLHVRKHTGERPFVCLFCGRAFGGKSDLTRHLRIHTGERPYHCEMCGKCFARADYLSKHLTTHIHQR